MAQAQHSDLTRDERNRKSPDEWKADRARADAANLVNPPPSLQDFMPQKAPRPRLEAAPAGKMPAHVAHSPLTHSPFADALRDMKPGDTLHVNPPVRPVVGQSAMNDTSPAQSHSRKLEPPTRKDGEPFKRKTFLSPAERADAISDSLEVGITDAASKWGVTPSALTGWRNMAMAVAKGQPCPPGPEIVGVNMPGATRQTAQDIFRPRARVDNEEVAVVVAAAVDAAKEDMRAKASPPEEVEALRSQLVEREATLAGYRLEIEKLRVKLETVEAHNDTLRTLMENWTAKRAARG